jgi:hypothetical protein
MTQNTQIQTQVPGSLAEILREDYWSNLHPTTKLIIKILQHIKSKLDDVAEVRAYLEDDEMLITTCKSEIRITKSEISFKRKSGEAIRVQRAKINIPDEVYKTIKQEVQYIIMHDAEPNYSFVIETLEKHLRRVGV